MMLAAIPIGLVLVRFEERELVGRFGDAYRSYQRDVPRFVPHRRSRKARDSADQSAMPQI